MGQGNGEPIGFKGLLNPQHKVALNGPNVGGHVQTRARHQHPVDLVKTVFQIVNREHDQNVNPISTEEINEGWQRKFRPWRFENREQKDTQRQCADHPRQVDTLHLQPPRPEGRGCAS